jgi:hypothetical protein
VCWCVVDENRAVPPSAVTCTDVNTDRSTSSRDKRKASSNDIASDESWHKRNKHEINTDMKYKLFLFAGNILNRNFYLSII